MGQGRRAPVFPAGTRPQTESVERPAEQRYFFHTINVVRDRPGPFLPSDAGGEAHAALIRGGGS
jgi:hypothetical protein